MGTGVVVFFDTVSVACEAGQGHPASGAEGKWLAVHENEDGLEEDDHLSASILSPSYGRPILDLPQATGHRTFHIGMLQVLSIV
eukprot:scaffold46826_cov66-Cyclotella_meneghiniana.AAC.5